VASPTLASTAAPVMDANAGAGVGAGVEAGSIDFEAGLVFSK
jgi:hypothetical protein